MRPAIVNRQLGKNLHTKPVLDGCLRISCWCTTNKACELRAHRVLQHSSCQHFWLQWKLAPGGLVGRHPSSGIKMDDSNEMLYRGLRPDLAAVSIETVTNEPRRRPNYVEARARRNEVDRIHCDSVSRSSESINLNRTIVGRAIDGWPQADSHGVSHPPYMCQKHGCKNCLEYRV